MRSIILILILCLSIENSKTTKTTNVDLIELNHFYNDDGHAYDQIIFYERSPDYRRYHVIAWKLIEDDTLLLPIKQNNIYTVTWFDTEHHVLRRVSSKVFNETWTKVDPERINKKLLEEKDRTPLFF